MANSSPPQREIKSVSRANALLTVLVTDTSAASPAKWP